LIDRREILDIAAQTSLTPHVVEKDYVLGWMLAGIYAHEELAESWIFKGGTCLKKCTVCFTAIHQPVWPESGRSQSITPSAGARNEGWRCARRA
jgi:hypothetical protein